MSLKIAITGHTKGIGKAIADALHGHTVIGFSRSNGYNISSDVKRIAQESRECDVFINNAYYDFAQCDLLDEMFSLWKNNSKTIININSRSIYGYDNSHIYSGSKKELRDLSIKKIFSPRQCRIININLGYVDTEPVKNIPARKLTTEQVANTVLWCLNQPHDIEIGELSIWRR